MRARRTAISRAAIVGLGALILAGCAIGGPASQGATEPSTAPPSASSAPTATVTPTATATPEPTATAGPTPTSAPSPSPAATAEGEMIVRAYFLLADAAGGEPTLVPVLREVPETRAVARAAMTALLAGPSATERDADPAISSLIPAGTELLDLAVADGTATVDLSAAFSSDADQRELSGRIAEVVYTLTQFSRVDRVRVEVDGAAIDGFGGTYSRRSLRDAWLPPMWVDDPAWGAAFAAGEAVSGLADVFEAQFRVSILDADSDVLTDRPVHATCGSGCWGRFEIRVGYDVRRGQWGTLRVYDPSERDGSPETIRDYPVWLHP